MRSVLTLVELIGALVVAGLLCAGFFVPYVAGIGLATNKATDKFLNTTCNLKAAALQQTTSLYARDGKTLIATFFENNRKSVPLSSVPTTVREALIDTEDRRFYQHHGVDVRGLARAALNQSDGETQGASTLTQQLVKQIREYTATSKAEQEAATAQTADRKIYEAKCALDLEKRYSKNQILEQYFNIAYFGEQSYGIFVAAQTYFGKTPKQLTVPEAAVLTGIVKDPTLYDPFQNPKAARERRNEVINNMAVAGHITARAAAAYEKTPIQLTNKPVNLGAQGCSFANDKAIQNVGFFCQYAMNWLENKLPDRIGGGLTARQIATGGYKIVTSIDPALQNQAQDALFKDFPAAASTTVIQPAIDPGTGEILSMGTSKHYAYGNIPQGKPGYTSLDLFKGAFSGSGSTYKYFTTIAALEAGLKPTQTLTTAGPKTQTYRPKNCGKLPAGAGVHNAGAYSATLSLRDALVQSSNTYFVGVEDQVFGCDMSTVVDTATTLGMHALNLHPAGSTVSYAAAAKRDAQYTFTLGQNNTSSLELTEAYGIAANDGIACDARPILSITDVTGKAVAFKQPTCTRKLDPWVARTAVDIMKGDTVTGTARNFGADFYQAGANRKDHWVASKTGTNNSTVCGAQGKCHDSSSNSSIWFVGLTPKFVATSAVINVDKPTSVLQIPKSVSTKSSADIFGALAAKFWIDSFKPTLEQTSWKWESPSQVPNAQDTPKILGELPGSADEKIRSAGFVPARYPIDCGSNYRSGVVAYAGPEYAAPGGIVTYCVSSGRGLQAGPPPSAVIPRGTGNTGNGNGNENGTTTSPRTRSRQTVTQAPAPTTSAPTTSAKPSPPPAPATSATPPPPSPSPKTSPPSTSKPSASTKPPPPTLTATPTKTHPPKPRH